MTNDLRVKNVGVEVVQKPTREHTTIDSEPAPRGSETERVRAYPAWGFARLVRLRSSCFSTTWRIRRRYCSTPLALACP